MLNRKVILAERPRYENESLEEYAKIPFNKRLRAYLVLDMLEEGLFACQLKYLEKKSEQILALFKTSYPGLNYASVPTSHLTIIPNNCKILEVITDEINSVHFEKIVSFLKLKRYDSRIRPYFSSFCEKYYRERIKVGTVVTIMNDINSYSVYYVKEKLDADFIGVILHYDPVTGLSASDEEVCVPYDSMYDCIAYSSEYKHYVETLIGEHKLKLTEGN